MYTGTGVYNTSQISATANKNKFTIYFELRLFPVAISLLTNLRIRPNESTHVSTKSFLSARKL